MSTPGKPRPQTRHRPIAEQCRRSPDKWQQVRTYPSHNAAYVTAWHIRHGAFAAYRPAGHFEAEVRTERGEPTVYARYIGPSTAADAA
jgi:hypothetical protein